MTAEERRPIPAVGAVVVDEGRLLLVRRARGAHAGAWAVPGGRQRVGERMREAVVREVREETGLEVEVGEPVLVGDILDPHDPPAWHYAVVDFRARVVGGALRAGDDAAAAEFVPFGEVRRRPLTPTMIELLDALGIGVVSRRPGPSDTD